MSACFELGNLCGNTIVSELIAPDHSATFVIFTRDCGATTGSYTQASILESGESLGNRSGNVLVLGTVQELRVEWLHAKKLKLVIPLKAEIFKNESAVGKITLEYVLQSDLTMESLIDR